jgi:hypothetical protein
MSGPVGSSTWFGTPGYDLDQSLRFDDGSLSSLTRTPAAAGNTKKWTFSCWYKRGVQDGESHTLFSTDSAGDDFDYIRVQTDDSVYVAVRDGDSNYVLRLITNRKLRDSSAWYHIVVRFDSTAGTPDGVSNALYINGELQGGLAAAVTPSQDDVTRFNAAVPHHIGQWDANAAYYLDGHLAEVNFVDGYSLSADYFGATGEHGEWEPIQYGGAYGTNGFYLPFKQDYSVEGFSTVISRGNATAKYIGGVGFQPDMVWNATRDASQNKVIYDSVRGVNNELRTNSDNAQATSDGVTAFSADGFSRGNGNDCNENNKTYVDWCWDMGGSNANNTTGGIDSVVRANTSYGQSIVTYTGTGSAATVGHGLGIAPKCIFVKNYNTASRNWAVLHMSQYGGGEGHKAIMFLNSDAAYSRTNQVQYWNSTAPTTSVFTVGTHNTTNEDGKLYVAYCWGDVTGFSKFHHYFGNGQATGNTTNVGFRPAWLLVKKTTTTEDWYVWDSVRDEGATFGKFMEVNTSTAELEGNVAETVTTFAITDTGFTPSTDDSRINSNGGTYMYMAFADNREFAFFLDQSGNNNDWEPNNLTESDISLDTPTNNFATLDPLSSGGAGFFEGNLKYTSTAHTGVGTLGISSGKAYFEVTVSGASNSHIGVCDIGKGINPLRGGGWSAHGGITYKQNGDQYRLAVGSNSSTTASYGASYTNGDIIGVALDVDNDTVVFYKNNASQGNAAVGSSFLSSNGIYSIMIYGGSAMIFVCNFGQDSSFAGNKVAQGNTDSNGEGDFYYAPPSGYLALCTKNLPEPSVDPRNHFNTILYTGDDSTDNDITGIGFETDFLWIKRRDATAQHYLFDSLRLYDNGHNKQIFASLPGAEGADDSGSSNSRVRLGVITDGFNLTNADTDLNASAGSYVAWNWKAGNANTAFSESGNNPGGIHRANVAAGFSIVSYTGTGAAGTVAHGLGAAPELMLIKNRGVADEWFVYYGDNTDYLVLDDSDATADAATAWNDTSPTSSVFTVSTDHSVNADGERYIAYCFHSVDGYSSVGSYIGNGNVDGPFIHTGFRPAFVLIKNISAAGTYWHIADSKRLGRNVIGQFLFPNTNEVESNYTEEVLLDITSNGFKLQGLYGHINGDGNTIVYLAIAEIPFKYANAR